MSKHLVILESPTKTKAVKNYLGQDFTVVSSKGHIRNLSLGGKQRLGINMDNFDPIYKIEKDKVELVEELKDLAKKSDIVYVATDPDREGEAIAHHLVEVLKVQERYKRIRFNEITKTAVQKAFENPDIIDDNLVKAQETRRILDRIIGFRLSKLLRDKIRSKSAGRVQSVALKFIVEREKECQKFVPQEYWTIEGLYKKTIIKLTKFNSEPVEIKNVEELKEIGKKLKNKFLVVDIEEKERIRNPFKPFTTSTMLQQSSTQLGFIANKTSIVAQQLYEGIKLGAEIKGFISYPRTDSVRLSDDFKEQTKKFIINNYGEEFLGDLSLKNKANGSKSKAPNVQDAHEAIRPTDITMTPDKAKKYLKSDQLKLYKMIYNRTLGSLMVCAKFLATTIYLDNNKYEFRMNGNKIIFEGFLKVLDNDEKINVLPNLKKGQLIEADKLEGVQHFTKSAPRFSEAKLIKKLEESGVGRPSTYAPTIKILKERGYVLLKNKALYASEKGILTSDTLQDWFKDIVNEMYTSLIENELDEISHGLIEHKPLIIKFWKEFEPRIEYAFENMPKLPVEKAGIKCPECGEDLVYRFGKFGKFIGCGSFPKCYYTHYQGPDLGKCPECKEGIVVIKINKKNQKFLACSNFKKTKCEYKDNYKESKEEETEEKENRINLLK
ncbi:type I DNA topoisomerase [Spiroplasma endosymbiont of Amphibalanus improvisus]|uniref:type I DNA topoisomerase n=1 Tax=Spiroplasma endosymbiont of Amphibalanus improvisus TaxID=3066327 RepID=UPI00313DA2BA